MTFNFKHIYQQPIPMENFCYLSQIKKRSTLECEFIFCTDKITTIWIVIDLYAQLEPACLSPYCIIKNASNFDNFIVDTMEQVSAGYYKYKLENCHIQKVSTRNRFKRISKKLQDLQTWRQTGVSLNDEDIERIENIISTDYIGKQFEEKVYIGFTPYAYDEQTNSKIPLDSTTYTEAIFNNWGSSLINPSYGPLTGGTEHIIKLGKNINLPYEIRLQLSDEFRQWQTLIYGQVTNDGLKFTLPPCTVSWQGLEENHLFYLEFLDEFEGKPKGRFKFVYKKVF